MITVKILANVLLVLEIVIIAGKIQAFVKLVLLVMDMKKMKMEFKQTFAFLVKYQIVKIVKAMHQSALNV